MKLNKILLESSEIIRQHEYLKANSLFQITVKVQSSDKAFN